MTYPSELWETGAAVVLVTWTCLWDVSGACRGWEDGLTRRRFGPQRLGPGAGRRSAG